MKLLWKLLLVLTIIIFIPLITFRFLVFNLDFYEKEFTKLNVYDKFPKETADENIKELISYLKNKDSLETDFFNEKEKQHLIDVKNLINKAISLFYLTLFLLIIFLILNYKSLSKPFLYSGVSIIILIIILLFLDFNQAFLNFHKLFFSNDLWLLNPETDNLINLFPQQFFSDFIKKVFINSFFISILLIISSFFLAKFEKKF